MEAILVAVSEFPVKSPVITPDTDKAPVIFTIPVPCGCNSILESFALVCILIGMVKD